MKPYYIETYKVLKHAEVMMRIVLLSLALLPYAIFLAVDAWMHEKARSVPRLEQCLHGGIGLCIGGFLVCAFAGLRDQALSCFALGLVVMSIDELGYHRGIQRRERLVHGAAALSLLAFLAMFLWTESRL